MVYIVLDLEWNSVYGPKIRGYINEIIEIGAVMLDERLRELSTFSVLVKSTIGRKLQTHVQEMTNISHKDLANGTPFHEAAAMLRGWIGGREHVVLSWGDGDIRVLLANTRYHSASRNLNYLQSYADLQAYFRHQMNTSRAQQIGLAAAGELLGIGVSGFALHRALDDSLFAAECFRRIYDPENFADFVHACEPAFFAELEYKPRIISDIRSPLVDRRQLYYICKNCGRPASQTTEWRFASRGFQAEFLCKNCGLHVKAMVTFKKLYSAVEVKRSARDVEPAPAEGAAQQPAEPS